MRLGRVGSSGRGKRRLQRGDVACYRATGSCSKAGWSWLTSNRARRHRPGRAEVGEDVTADEWDPESGRPSHESGRPRSLAGRVGEDPHHVTSEPEIDPTALAGLKAPVLVAAGDRDLVMLEHTIALYRPSPNAQMFIVPGRLTRCREKARTRKQGDPEVSCSCRLTSRSLRPLQSGGCSGRPSSALIHASGADATDPTSSPRPDCVPGARGSV